MFSAIQTNMQIFLLANSKQVPNSEKGARRMPHKQNFKREFVETGKFALAATKNTVVNSHLSDALSLPC